MTTFAGFPAGLVSFFAGLRADNTKAYFESRRSEWERDVRDPMCALVDEVASDVGPMRILRPNRDLRFSVDKSPYRLHIAALGESHTTSGAGAYVEASDLGMTAGSGASGFDRDQLARYRAAVDDPAAGAALDQVRTALRAQGLTLAPGMSPALARVPRGFDPDHPRADLLRAKGAVVMVEWPQAEWMRTREVLDRVRGVWTAASGLADWLDRHVGPAGAR